MFVIKTFYNGRLTLPIISLIFIEEERTYLELIIVKEKQLSKNYIIFYFMS
jgi:hypothetical protein